MAGWIFFWSFPADRARKEFLARWPLIPAFVALVTAAQEEERQRIARELHDGVGPALASLNIRLHTARKLLERDHHPVAEEKALKLPQWGNAIISITTP